MCILCADIYFAQDTMLHGLVNQSDRHSEICDSAIVSTSTIDSLITLIMEDYHVAGVSTSVIRNNNIVWNRSYGFANIKNWIPVTDTTAFMLASVSKTITGAALLKLWEQGLFNLDDNINDYMPIRIVNPYCPDSVITFRMLLTHTSSLKDNWDVMFSTYVPGDTPIRLDEYVRSYFLPGGYYYNATKNFYNWKPGKSWSYCNHNFVLIGYLVSMISNIPFDQYCRDSLFLPIHMNRTSWFLSGLDTNTVAMPYTYNGVKYVPYGHFGYADYPAGALRSSTRDLARFLTMFLSGGELDEMQLLQKKTIDTIATIQYPSIISNQGLTWFRAQQGSRTVWEHSGGDQGVRTKIGFCRQDSSAVIVLTNGESTTASETIYSILWDAVSTLTAVEPSVISDASPADFLLEQNYPNPFNGITVVQVHVSQSTHLTARIYDIAGRLLTTCFEGKHFLPGSYSIMWDCTDWKGNEANSGIYFCRVESENSSQVIKLILLR